MISIEGKKLASKCCSNRALELGNFCRQHAAHDLVRASDTTSNIRGGSRLHDHLAQGGTSGGIDWCGKPPEYTSSAGVHTSDGSRSVGSHWSLRARGSWRGRATSKNAPPAILGQPASAAAANGVSLNDAEIRMKVETQMALPQSFGWNNTSSESAAARPISCDGMRSGSSSSTRDWSYGSSATSGRSMKRLRRAAPLESISDVATDDDVTSGEGGGWRETRNGRVCSSLSRIHGFTLHAREIAL